MGDERFGVFEKRVRRRTPGPKNEEVTGGYRKLCDENFIIITGIESRMR
jgi:hypothetical protein